MSVSQCLYVFVQNKNSTLFSLDFRVTTLFSCSEQAFSIDHSRFGSIPQMLSFGDCGRNKVFIRQIVAVITKPKPRNCIWKNVKITAKKRLLIQFFTTI